MKLGWSAIIAATFLIASQASAQTTCDLAVLRDYPMERIIGARALPLHNPTAFFPDPDDTDPGSLESILDADPQKVQDALERGLQTFGPDERNVLILAALSYWTPGDDGLVNFFVLEQGALIETVLAVLDQERLDAHAAIIREGRDLFGPDFGTPQQRYQRWSDGYGTILDPALDAALKQLSRRFNALGNPLQIAAQRIAASPQLSAIYDPLLRDVDDEDRLALLASGLWSCLDHYGPPEQMAARLDQLPHPYDQIIVIYIFEAEMLNGSVHQFFFNSSGALAPDVALALQAMDLPRHSAAVERGMALFPTPYPRDTQKRRGFMASKGAHFDNLLYELTGDVDDGEMNRAMIRLARDANILPR